MSEVQAAIRACLYDFALDGDYSQEEDEFLFNPRGYHRLAAVRD